MSDIIIKLDHIGSVGDKPAKKIKLEIGGVDFGVITNRRGFVELEFIDEVDYLLHALQEHNRLKRREKYS